MLKNGIITLLMPDEVTPKAVAEYYQHNKDFLKEFEPDREEEFYTLTYQEKALAQEKSEMAAKRMYSFYIVKKDAPGRIIGIVRLSNVVWGAFCSAFLGYKLDRDHINCGYMTMAVSLVTEYAFSVLGLHRIEANVMPRNQRSHRVLEKCGYIEEGRSVKYLKINGVWEDHIHMVKLNDKE